MTPSSPPVDLRIIPGTADIGQRRAILAPFFGYNPAQMNRPGPDNQIVSVGLIQMRCSQDAEQNFQKAVQSIRKAAEQGAHIVCLQELFRSQYFCQDEDAASFDLAEPIPGPSTERLGQISQELGIVLVASLFERRTSGIYHNTAVVIGPGGDILGKYRKMHIPDDPYYYEKFYFTPGDLGFQSHATPFGQIGVLVCWDQWFPEAARVTALKGAHLLFCPTAIGWLQEESADVGKAQQEAWETVQRAHAVANGVFLAAINRIGQEGVLTFWGQSFVCDPLGRVLERASSDREEILVVSCDLNQVEQTRRHWPFLRDRRVDAYKDIRARFLD